jgi:signal transduction histidine kinase
MNPNPRLRLLSNVVIAYMLLAFTWWSVLLFTKNKDAFLAKVQLRAFTMPMQEGYDPSVPFEETAEFKDLEKKYLRQEWMILGEAAVFIISLVIGIWLINRSYNKEMLAARQQRNFLLSITHELKSPIASIRLVLETILKRELRPDQLRGLSKNALHETERLHRLVDDLLLSARLEAAYQAMFEDFDISLMLRELTEQLTTKYPKAQLSFQADQPELICHADRAGITSVALNLIENAIKYSEEPAEVNISLLRDAHQVQIQIADQGIGIPSKEKEKVFQKFYRVGNEDTRQTKGTGLGLYIVDQIIKAHHGKINIEDNPPQGTVFTIILPLQQPNKLKPVS